MLEGLDAIPWAQLTHAFGSAANVAAMLLKLASSDAAEQQQGFDECYVAIWHQGTVYEATVYAMPFLMELAMNRAMSRRAELVGLISALADGGEATRAVVDRERSGMIALLAEDD